MIVIVKVSLRQEKQAFIHFQVISMHVFCFQYDQYDGTDVTGTDKYFLARVERAG